MRLLDICSYRWHTYIRYIRLNYNDLTATSLESCSSIQGIICCGLYLSESSNHVMSLSISVNQHLFQWINYQHYQTICPGISNMLWLWKKFHDARPWEALRSSTVMVGSSAWLWRRSICRSCLARNGWTPHEPPLKSPFLLVKIPWNHHFLQGKQRFSKHDATDGELPVGEHLRIDSRLDRQHPHTHTHTWTHARTRT